MLSFCPVQKIWVSVSIHFDKDSRWTSSDSLIYGVAYLSAKQWFSEERARCIAEAIVYKQLLPGLFYDSTLEADIEKLYASS